MIRNKLIAFALAVSFLAGFLIADNKPWPNRRHDLETSHAFTLPVAAQSLWFPPVEDNRGAPLDDDQFEALLEMLKERLAAEETLADFGREAAIYLHGFVRRIAIPVLTGEQTDRATRYLEALVEWHPDHRTLIDEQIRKVRLYGPGTGGVPPFAAAFPSWFPAIPNYPGTSEHFDDPTAAEMLRILDELLRMPETVLDFTKEAREHFRCFGRMLQRGRLTDTQVARIGAYLSEVSARHPDADELIQRERNRIEKLTPGRIAPNIFGPDLQGVDFELRDYRGDIVILYFTGHWCGPCQVEYPYQRFILDLFKDDPVTILAVNSDNDPIIAHSLNEEKGLHYRAWWDGGGRSQISGPLANAWGIQGWPSTYILDTHGVVRYVGKRQLDVISAVQDLLREMRMRET